MDWQYKITNLREKVTLDLRFLDSRIGAEEEARYLLHTKAGKFSKWDFCVFCELCNTELVPPKRSFHFRDKESPTRFQPACIGANRKHMIQCLEACNKWIAKLWQSDDKNVLEVLEEFWKMNQVMGAGTGFPTMIMYLKDTMKFNVWLPFLVKGINILSSGNLPTPGIQKNRNVNNYINYNELIKDKLKSGQNKDLKPQEIDYILYWIRVESLNTPKVGSR